MFLSPFKPASLNIDAYFLEVAIVENYYGLPLIAISDLKGMLTLSGKKKKKKHLCYLTLSNN